MPHAVEKANLHYRQRGACGHPTPATRYVDDAILDYSSLKLVFVKGKNPNSLGVFM